MMTKAIIRGEIGRTLKTLSSLDLEIQSDLVCAKLLGLRAFQESRAVSIFMSMPNCEVQTLQIIRKSLEVGKRVYVPKIVGKAPQDMIMIELSSCDELQNFATSKWGIPEPLGTEEDEAIIDIIDLVVVPGVGFDKKLARLGHGKGYYDHFLGRFHEQNRVCISVGLALEEQIIAEVPMSSHDKHLNFVLSPSNIFG